MKYFMLVFWQYLFSCQIISGIQIKSYYKLPTIICSINTICVNMIYELHPLRRSKCTVQINTDKNPENPQIFLPRLKHKGFPRIK